MGQWTGIALAGALALGLGYFGLRSSAAPRGPEIWLLVSGGVFLTFLLHLLLRFDRNRRPGSMEVLGGVGIANALTLFRGLLAASLAGFVGFPRGSPEAEWMPGVLLLAVVVGDALDGFVARRVGRPTVLGAELDMATDRAAILAAVSVAVLQGRLAPVFLALGFLPYLFAGHMLLRRQAGRPLPALSSSALRQLVGTLLSIFLIGALLPVLDPGALRIPGALLLLAVLGSFARDWLALVKEGRSEPG
jgi:CDP-diacylglycerol--glycerol-3-phosphate 3-phosphatidyltransferase